MNWVATWRRRPPEQPRSRGASRRNGPRRASRPAPGRACARPRSPEVPRLRVRQDLARVVLRSEEAPDQHVDAELLGTANLDDPVRWGPGGSASDRRRNVLGRHRLDQCLRQVDRVAMRRVIGDLVDELEELSGVDDGVGDRRSLDQGLLRELRPEVAGDRRRQVPALGQLLGADDRQGDVVTHAGLLLGVAKIGGRLSEELDRRSEVEGR